MRRRLSLLFIFWLAMPGGLTGQSSDAARAAWDRCTFPADSLRFVVVLDQSGSMRPHWARVSGSLPAMVDAMPDGSWFQLEVFSSGARTEIYDFQVLPSSRAALKAQLSRVPVPDPKGATDIGAALLRAADVIEDGRKRDRGLVTFLFVVTDGRHAPPPGAQFSNASAFGPLHDRWKALNGLSNLHLRSYAVPIGEDGVSGADMVRNITGSRIVAQQSAGRIGEIIQSEIRDATRDLRRVLAESEIASPRLSARAASSPQPVAFWGRTEAPVVVKSGAACVTYALDSGSESGPVQVAPGDSAVLSIPLHSRLGWMSFPWQPVRTDTIGVDRAGSPAAAGRISFEPNDELVMRGVQAAPKDAPVLVTGVLGSEPIGWVSFLLLSGGASILVLVGVVYLARPARLHGTVRLPDGGITELGAQGKKTIRLALPNGAHVSFVARKREQLGDGYNSRIGVRKEKDTHIEVEVGSDAEFTESSRVIWFGSEAKITVLTADGARSTLTWDP